MVNVIQTGFIINVSNKSYTVVEINDMTNYPNIRREMDKSGIKDRMVAQRGKSYYSVMRYNNGTLGETVKY